MWHSYGCMTRLSKRILLLSGTLVTFVPFREGLVCAADSRSTLPQGEYIDSATKLKHDSTTHTLYTVTGKSTFYDIPRSLKPTALNVRTLMSSEEPCFDASMVIESVLPKRFSLLNQAFIDPIREKVSQAFNDFADRYGQQRLQGEIFQVVLAQYNPRNKLSTLASFKVVMNNNVGIYLTETEFITKGTLDPATHLSYGEVEYLNSVVFTKGRHHFPLDFFKLTATLPRIQDLGQPVALYLARGIIQAAISMAEVEPPASGIGGKIQVKVLH